jgi:hypothetical protein
MQHATWLHVASCGAVHCSMHASLPPPQLQIYGPWVQCIAVTAAGSPAVGLSAQPSILIVQLGKPDHQDIGSSERRHVCRQAAVSKGCGRTSGGLLRSRRRPFAALMQRLLSICDLQAMYSVLNATSVV